MSVPLGGFEFTVSADLSPAQRALQQFVQQAQQAGRSVEQALGGGQRTLLLKADGTPLVREAQKAEEAIAKVARAVKQVSDRSTIVVRADVSDAQDGLDQIVGRARAISETRVNLTARLNNVKEAEAAVERMAAALRNARAGETINLNVRSDSVERADVAVRQLERDINRAKAAGARVNVNVQTNDQGGGTLREIGRGFLQQATPGLATGAAAAAGVVAAQAVGQLAQAMQEAIATGIRYNASLETSTVQMRVFLGSAEASAEAMRRFQQIAEQTPFSLREINESAAAFANISGGNIERLERFVQLATQLAAVNPSRATGGGIEGATVALREALSGDFTSIVERFRVSRAEVQRLRDLGLAGEELAVALVKAAGASKTLSDALTNTFEGRASKAAEILERLAGAATKPLFDTLTVGLQGFNETVEKGSTGLERFLGLMGRLGPGNVANALLPGGLGVVAGTSINTGINAGAGPLEGSAPAAGLSPSEQQRQARIAAAQDEQTRAEQALRKQEADLKKIERQLEANARAAREITERYEEQLRPLEAQQRALDAQIAANQAQGREIAARARAAEGPTETRAQNAAAAVLLEHERQLLEIRHRRAEISEQLAEAEQAAANRAAEAQIRAAEQALNAARQRAQAEREARQEVLEGLREEIRARQEARQAALDGLREYIQAVQEARREVLDAIREEIAARQEARREAIDGLREQAEERRRQYDLEREGRDEARQAAQEAFSEQERLAERAHSRSMERYQDQIQALRDQLDNRREQAEAERQLADFDRAERARQRAFSIASAERNVRQARTGRERADALQRLAEIRAQAEADARREALQERIAQQQQETDRRREAIQAKIAELERKAREEDRAYQRQRDARREAFEAQQRAQQAADRAEDKAERERRRAEDEAIRAAEKADREATKREQAELRALEKADREQTKAENAALRAAEAAARAADRADQARLREEERRAREEDRAAERALREQERAVAAQREEQQARLAAQEEAREATRLERLREQADIEGRILKNREESLAAIDIAQKAAAEADRIRNEAEAAALADRKAALDDQYNAIVRNRDAALSGLEEEAAKLTIAKDRATEFAEQMKRVAEETAKAVEQAKNFTAAFSVPVASGDLDAPSHHSVQASAGVLAQAGAKVQEAAAAIFKMFTDPSVVGSPAWAVAETIRLAGEAVAGWAKVLNEDTTAQEATTAWSVRSSTAAFQAWRAQSPSEVTIELGKFVAEGFVVGLQSKEREIVDALEAPWIEVDQRFFPEVERKWKQAGTDHADAYLAGFKAARLPDEIERCIDDVLRRIERNDPNFKRAGGRAARQFSEGWCDLLDLKGCFAREMEWMVENARAYGTQAGANFSRGFEQTARTSSGGPTSGGGTRWFNPFTGQTITREQDPGWPWERVGASGSGSQAQRPQARALGGPLWPGQDFLVGENGMERIHWPAGGMPEVIPNALTRATMPPAGIAQINSRGAVSVSVNQTIHATPGMDPNALARVVTDQAVAAIIDVLDDAERRSPNPLPRYLPGAVR